MKVAETQGGEEAGERVEGVRGQRRCVNSCDFTAELASKKTHRWKASAGNLFAFTEHLSLDLVCCSGFPGNVIDPCNLTLFIPVAENLDLHSHHLKIDLTISIEIEER